MKAYLVLKYIDYEGYYSPEGDCCFRSKEDAEAEVAKRKGKGSAYDMITFDIHEIEVII